MPIKGLTTNRIPQFPILGKIRKGGKKQGNRFGQDLPYFRFDARDLELQEWIEKHLGSEPNKIQIQLPHEGVEDNFPCWLEDYSANKDLKLKCDGENIQMYLDKSTMQYRRAKNMVCVRDQGKCSCKEVGRLKVIVPQILEAGYMGYFILETHSKNDIIHISQFLEAIHSTTRCLSNIPMILSKVEREISVPYQDKQGNMKRSRAKKYLIDLALHPSIIKNWVKNNLLTSFDEEAPPELAEATIEE